MHVGLDLGRNTMAVAVVTNDGELVEESSVRPDGPGLGRLVDRVGGDEPVYGVVESMSGARSVYDFCSDAGWGMSV